MFQFEILKTSRRNRARFGKIKTPHGTILTPAFIPVATLGTIKGALDFTEIKKTGVQCQIVNTFHFLDMNWQDTVERACGLHKFMNFSGPIFTDSGGFQVFSLGRGAEFGLGKVQSVFPKEKKNAVKKSSENKLLSNSQEHWNNHQPPRKGLVKKIAEEGVKFLSPRDGREIMLTPEKSAEIQKKLGADFIYMLDICGSVMDGHNETLRDLEMTHRWFRRFLDRSRKTRMTSGRPRKPNQQGIFAIIQGGGFKDLREKATEFVNSLPVFGIAIGGALGKTRKDMFKTISWINKKIDFSRPHHLLGIGDPESIPEIIKSGIDLFDCALPTRVARHGTALIHKGAIDVKKGGLKNKFQPIDKRCSCFTCENYSLAQLNFLFKAKEMLGPKLLTIHNLAFMESCLAEIRRKIEISQL